MIINFYDFLSYDKFFFKNYLFLFLFACSSYSFGKLILSKVNFSYSTSSKIPSSITSIFGLGLIICIFQLLLIFGFFNIYTTLLVIFFPIFLNLKFNLSSIKNFFPKSFSFKQFDFYEKLLFVLLLILLIPLFFKMLSIPKAWDELNYHLPHAKSWATAGSLVVNHNFRYPWFPYNFDILFSFGLLFDNDIFPKMVHGYAGLLTGLLLFQIGIFYFNKKIALLTAIFWFLITRTMYEKAYIELGYSLFIFASIFLMHIWINKNGKNCFTIFLSFFFMGIALGIKYQSLFFLVPFIIYVPNILKRFSLKELFLILIIFIFPFIYWYLRNLFLTGNPVNPIFSPFFGFYDWNVIDYDYQFSKLESKRYFSDPLLLISFLFITLIKKYKSFTYMYIYLVFGFVIWFLVSGYGRYLYPIYPVMCLFSSAVLINYFHISLNSIKFLKNKYIINLINTFFIFLLIVSFYDNFLRIKRSILLTGFNEKKRNEILHNEINGYRSIDFLNNIKDSYIYQMGFEDSIFYFKNPILGEVFGPGRYYDFRSIPPEILNQKFIKLGITHFIINTDRFPFVTGRENFLKYFELIHKDKGNEVYILKKIK